MKKRHWKVLSVACVFMVLACFSACNPEGLENSLLSSSQASESSEMKQMPTQRPAATFAPEEPAVNPLTGLDISPEGAGKRPVAVTIGNGKEALPQYGISKADVIFELPVEYGITRLMALYGDYTDIPEICSVRSCRYYFPILAVGYDAFYVHWGQDETVATDILNMLDINTMDGMRNSYELFHRDETRLISGYNYEHTGVFDGPGLVEALEKAEMRTDLQVHKTDPFFLFSDKVKAHEGQASKKPSVRFSHDYSSTFLYNETSGIYYKQHSGKDHRDGLTGEKLGFTNLFLLETNISVRDAMGRIDLNWEGGEDFTGYYISQGIAEKISWTKEDIYANLEFTTEDGTPLSVNPGKSYIAFVSPDSITLDLE